jgi:hypothetical protein
MDCGGKRSATSLWIGGAPSQSAVAASLCQRSPYASSVDAFAMVRVQRCAPQTGAHPSFIAGYGLATVSPLTPALSPLRGEGARRTTFANRTSLAALGAFVSERCRDAVPPLEPASASAMTPSPLNGERAGVRGEDTQDRPCNKLRCAPLSVRDGIPVDSTSHPSHHATSLFELSSQS